MAAPSLVVPSANTPKACINEATHAVSSGNGQNAEKSYRNLLNCRLSPALLPLYFCTAQIQVHVRLVRVCARPG